LIRLAAVLFLAAVVLGECLVAYRLLSSASAQGTSEAAPPSPTAATKERTPGEAAGVESEPSKSEPGKSEHPAKSTSIDPLDEGDAASATGPVEVDLGQFTVTTHQPAANTTMRIEFRLYGIIAGKDKEEFDKVLKAVNHRFREQVLVTVRAAEGPDLADAGLGLIKRQILEKTNTLLGKRLLRALIVSDFSYMEQ
jgi:flagellar FliL protein